MPERDEMVVCEITKINPNSAFAKLLEYDRSGMIHVSEVAKRWVKNIREFVKERQLLVCKVGRVEGDSISLSIKRVNRNQADRRLQEFKRERNAEKFLEQIGKKMGKSLDDVYEEVGYELQDKFGSLNKTFEIALKNPDLLKEKGIDSKWADEIINIAQKNFVEKTYEIKAILDIHSYEPDGLNIIKKALLGAAKDGVEVKYISAPKYQLKASGKDIKGLREMLEDRCQKVKEAVEAKNGVVSYKLEGKN